VRLVAEGIETYRAFLPADWEPPSQPREPGQTRDALGQPETFCWIAEEDGDLIGQVTVIPAARSGRPLDEPSLAHLANLFVRESHWGTGLASALDDAAIEHARDRGFAEMRLFVAAAHARARRFYEREGWHPVSEPFFEPPLGLELVEYRIAL
jgi:GNAT superfamily N-acetyltransferase